MTLTLTPTTIPRRARRHQIAALIGFCFALGNAIVAISIGSYIIAVVNVVIMTATAMIFQTNSRIIDQCDSTLRRAP